MCIYKTFNTFINFLSNFISLELFLLKNLETLCFNKLGVKKKPRKEKVLASLANYQ